MWPEGIVDAADVEFNALVDNYYIEIYSENYLFLYSLPRNASFGEIKIVGKYFLSEMHESLLQLSKGKPVKPMKEVIDLTATSFCTQEIFGSECNWIFFGKEGVHCKLFYPPVCKPQSNFELFKCERVLPSMLAPLFAPSHLSLSQNESSSDVHKYSIICTISIIALSAFIALLLIIFFKRRQYGIYQVYKRSKFFVNKF